MHTPTEAEQVQRSAAAALTADLLALEATERSMVCPVAHWDTPEYIAEHKARATDNLICAMRNDIARAILFHTIDASLDDINRAYKVGEMAAADIAAIVWNGRSVADHVVS